MTVPKVNIFATAISAEDSLSSLFERLFSSSRKERQDASAAIESFSLDKPMLLIDYSSLLADALFVADAQTRLHCLNALSHIAVIDAGSCEKAIEGAEDSLFDEKHALLRHAAFRFLCSYGSNSSQRAEFVWPLLDEAIQCYHGNPEYFDMLSSLSRFIESDLPDQIKIGIKSRFTFDALNGKGSLGKRARSIIAKLE